MWKYNPIILILTDGESLNHLCLVIVNTVFTRVQSVALGHKQFNVNNVMND